MLKSLTIKILKCLIILSAILFAAPSILLAAASTVNLTVEPGCGNGYVETGEECDDGNNNSNDGCSSSCITETGSGGGSGGGGETININIYGIESTAKINQAEINWVTNKIAQCKIKYSDTQDTLNVEKDSVYSERNHTVDLINLSASTNYYFQIHCSDNFGHTKETSIQQFTTQAEQIIEVTNVADFIAVYNQDVKAIDLSWTNPGDLNFAKVIVVRSTDFYPKNIQEGDIIYDGLANKIVDKNIVAGQTYYYTNFAYDKNNNHSSGAIALVEVPIKDEPIKEEPVVKDKPVKDDPIKKDPILIKDPVKETKQEEPIKEELVEKEQVKETPEEEKKEAIKNQDQQDKEEQIQESIIEFYTAQETIKLSEIKDEFEKNQYNALPGMNLNIKIARDKLPQIFKSIILTIIPKDAKTSNQDKNYLLQQDKTGQYFTSSIKAPLQIQEYDANFSILDNENKEITKLRHTLNVVNFGKVVNMEIASGWWEKLLLKTAQAVEKNQIYGTPINSAQVNIYQVFPGNIINKWDGKKFAQINPIYSNQNGEYGLSVPNGNYFLETKKNNYFIHRTLVFSVKNNIINQNIGLIYIPDFSIIKLLIILLILGLIYVLIRSRMDKNKVQNIEPVAGR